MTTPIYKKTLVAKGLVGFTCALSFMLLAPVVAAGPSVLAMAKPVKISIIIDDIGYRLKEGREVIALEAPITVAVLPNAPKAKVLARLAHQQGKEVLLHMPMQSVLGQTAEAGGLNIGMHEGQVVQSLKDAFNKVPYAVGMNNHQGSLLTRNPVHMGWVMKEIKQSRHFFVDSRTSKHSVAAVIAKEEGVPVISRDVFLDHEVSVERIEEQFDRLIVLAQSKGYAVAIGHPHKETLRVLRKMLPKLKALGIEVVPVASQLKSRQS